MQLYMTVCSVSYRAHTNTSRQTHEFFYSGFESQVEQNQQSKAPHLFQNRFCEKFCSSCVRERLQHLFHVTNVIIMFHHLVSDYMNFVSVTSQDAYLLSHCDVLLGCIGPLRPDFHVTQKHCRLLSLPRRIKKNFSEILFLLKFL